MSFLDWQLQAFQVWTNISRSHFPLKAVKFTIHGQRAFLRAFLRLQSSTTSTERCFSLLARLPLSLNVVYGSKVSKSITPTLERQEDSTVSQQF